ncbi:MAG: Sulfotransferase [Verrucomicrobiales bacterium]|jgi:Tfp pilus assembly protein PilF|nr:Sulfotransferase [Verrucomicrobiales bacterium]
MTRRHNQMSEALSHLFTQAAEAWRNQDYEAAIRSLEHASKVDRINPSIQLDLARAYGLRYEYSAAQRCLDKAVRLAPGKAQALVAAGGRCQEFGHYEMAKRFFDRAIAENGNNCEALVTLAELSERHHENDRALDLVTRALKREPAHSRAQVVKARLLRITGKLEEGENTLREAIANPACDPSNRIRAWYELGQILDRQCRYEEAMAAFLEAKALQLPGAATLVPILNGIQNRILEMERTITADVLQRWCDPAAELIPSRPLAILCGHPRSGTTLLEQMLDSHPDIVTAEETHILHDEAYLPLSRGFPDDTSILEVLNSAAPASLKKSRADYFRFTELFIGKTIGDRLLIDKNPALNVLIPAAVRIFPEARFLVALRDPRDVCLSCFMQPLALNPVSSAYLSLDGTIRQYASVMGFWRSILPKLSNAWMEVRYETLVGEFEDSARRILTFLGKSWNPEVLKFHEYARAKPVRSPTYADVVNPVNNRAVGRWANYSQYFESYLDKLQPFLDAFGYS